MIKLKGKIILVDDDNYEKDMLERALKKRGWDSRVEYFGDPEQALEHLRQNADEIFLIISDMNMPTMNGMDFKKSIDNDPILREKSIPLFLRPLLRLSQKLPKRSLIAYRVFSENPIQPKNKQICSTLLLSTGLSVVIRTRRSTLMQIRKLLRKERQHRPNMPLE